MIKTTAAISKPFYFGVLTTTLAWNCVPRRQYAVKTFKEKAQSGEFRQWSSLDRASCLCIGKVRKADAGHHLIPVTAARNARVIFVPVPGVTAKGPRRLWQ